MRLTRLWLVIRPSAVSTIDDICFACESPTDLCHQFLGGLRGDEVLAMFTGADEAKTYAQDVLSRRLRGGALVAQ